MLNVLFPSGLRASFANVVRIHEYEKQFLTQRLPLIPNVYEYLYLETELVGYVGIS